MDLVVVIVCWSTLFAFNILFSVGALVNRFHFAHTKCTILFSFTFLIFHRTRCSSRNGLLRDLCICLIACCLVAFSPLTILFAKLFYIQFYSHFLSFHLKYFMCLWICKVRMLHIDAFGAFSECITMWILQSTPYNQKFNKKKVDEATRQLHTHTYVCGSHRLRLLPKHDTYEHEVHSKKWALNRNITKKRTEILL